MSKENEECGRGPAGFLAKAQRFREVIRTRAAACPAAFRRRPGVEPQLRALVEGRRQRVLDTLSEIATWLDRVSDEEQLGAEFEMLEELDPMLFGYLAAVTDLAFERHGVMPSGPLT